LAFESDALEVQAPGRHEASVIWLHGLGADGHDFEPLVPELQLPRDHGVRFVFPHAPIRPITVNGGMAMRGWYDVAEMDLTRREDESGIRASARLIGDYIAREIGVGIPSEHIVIAGFSQGGAMALFAGLRFPLRLAGIVALSAYLPLPDTLAAEAHPANARTVVLMAHGTVDPIIPHEQGERSAGLLQARGYPLEWRSYRMAHAVCAEEVSAVAAWLRERLMTTLRNLESSNRL